MFMSKCIRLVLLLISFFLLLVPFSTPLYAENTHPPTVSSITGPINAYVGQTYTFSTTVESTSEYGIIDARLKIEGYTIKNVTAGEEGCSETSCTVTSTFSPADPGTFYIYTYTGYHAGTENWGCDSLPTNGYADCQNSSNKYITFVVSAAPTKPVVESITGPTTGIVGQPYSFSTVVSSITGVEISSIRLAQTNNALTPNNATNLAFKTAGVDSNCTSYLCTATGSFTPSVAGTYYIFTFSHYNNVDCDTHLSTIPLYTCFNSAGKYITFVVKTEAEAQNDEEGTSNEELPSTGLFFNQTRNILVGLGFISLGIFITPASQITRILNFLNKSRAGSRRSKFEKKF